MSDPAPYKVRSIENRITRRKAYGVFYGDERTPWRVFRTERAANKWVTQQLEWRAIRRAWVAGDGR